MDVRFGLLPLIARLLLIVQFLVPLHEQGTPPLVGAALVIEVVGSVCLALGAWSRSTATVLFIYLGIVSVPLHDFKTLGIMGGLLMIAAYGAGTWSVDWLRLIRLQH